MDAIIFIPFCIVVLVLAAIVVLTDITGDTIPGFPYRPIQYLGTLAVWASLACLYPYGESVSLLIIWAFLCALTHTMLFGEVAIIEPLWSLIPDRCQMPGCKRQGMYGNENVEEDGMIVCDYCSVRYYLIKQELIDG